LFVCSLKYKDAKETARCIIPYTNGTFVKGQNVLFFSKIDKLACTKSKTCT